MDNLERYISDNRDKFDTDLPPLSVWSVIEKKLMADTSRGDIETFIGENRSAFDTEIPHLKIWAGIDKTLNPPTQKKQTIFQTRLAQPFGRIAAAVALLIIGAVAGFYLNDKTEAVAAANDLEEVAPNFKQTERYYNQQVQEKLSRLASYEQTDPSVLSDLKQIDEVQEELKKELEEAPTSTREEIVRRVIQNYQIKLNILERVLEQVDQHESKNFENQKNPQRHDSI
jgi:hypothetical protein